MYNVTPRYCYGQYPLVVGPKGKIPSDASAYYPGVGEPIGCNRLRCGLCEEMVTFEPDPIPVRRPFRRYSCRCTEVPVRENGTVEKLASGWHCSGHPLPSFPFDLDGVRIAEDMDYNRLVRNILYGGVPEGATWERARCRRKYAPAFWLEKLYGRLIGTVFEETLGEAVANALREPDARVRSLALEFFGDWAWYCYRCPPGWKRIVELRWGGNLEGFQGVKDPLRTARTLYDKLIDVCGFLECADEAGRPNRSDD